MKSLALLCAFCALTGLAPAQTLTPGGQPITVTTVTNPPTGPVIQPVPTRVRPPTINPVNPAAAPAKADTTNTTAKGAPPPLAPLPTLPAAFAPQTPPAKTDTIRPATTPATTTATTVQPATGALQPVAGALQVKPSAGGPAAVRTNVTALVTGTDGEKILPAGTVKFVNMPLEQVLEIYSGWVNRTLIRAPAVAVATPITLVSQTELTIAEAVQALDSLLALNSITMIPVGEKFMTVVPTAQVLPEAAAFTKKGAEELPEASQFVTKIIQLTNAKPSEVIPVVQPFAKIQGGLLAVDSTQMLIIRDYAVNVKRMLELIEKIDVAVPLEENMEVIPIKYALASEISSVLGSLTSGGAVTGTAGRAQPANRAGQTRSRSLGASGSTGVPGVAGQQGQVQPGQPGYNPALAAQAGQNVNAFQQQLQRIVGAAQGAVGANPLLGAARIIPYERNNAILVIGTKQELEMTRKLVEQLDRVQPQVLIEAIIMEVSLDDTLKAGVSFAQSPKSFNSTILGRGGNKNGTFGSSLTNLSNSALPDGFSYFANLGSAWEVALTAIQNDNTVNVLSRPRIQTSHAETATLFIGDTVPYISGTYFGGVNGQASSQYQQREIGITLSVLPIINDDGLVVMDILQNIEQLGTSIKIDGNDVPQTSKRNAQAKVAVRNGETIILGGFISSNKSKSRSGVPYLKDVPYLGALFRSNTDINKRVELIVLIRPTVLKDPTDAAIAATHERDKLAGVKRAEMEILSQEKRLNDRNIAEMIEQQKNAAKQKK